jgi:hypothetical protein
VASEAAAPKPEVKDAVLPAPHQTADEVDMVTTDGPSDTLENKDIPDVPKPLEPAGLNVVITPNTTPREGANPDGTSTVSFVAEAGGTTTATPVDKGDGDEGVGGRQGGRNSENLSAGIQILQSECNSAYAIEPRPLQLSLAASTLAT